MKIGIIGAGFTGLSAGLDLVQKGHEVTIFERDSLPGGLAQGFGDNRWTWNLESHYHHLFTNDTHALTFAEKVGVKIKIVRPKTSTFINGTIYQLDSPLSLVLFPLLGIVDRLRTGAVLAYLKLTHLWKPLEKVSSERFLRTYMGEKSWEVLWEPLFRGKFGKYIKAIPASWFWARIKKRTPALAYPQGGFGRFAKKAAELVIKNKGNIKINTQVVSIEKYNNKIRLITDRKDKKEEYVFDKVICTLPFPLLAKITKELPENYGKKVTSLTGIGAVNLVIALKKKFLTDTTYWLNICEKGFPFLAVVEHTNFMDKKLYGGDNLVYIGNYLPPDHEYFKLDSKKLFAIYLPYLKKINKKFSEKYVRKMWLFKAGFAQPIITLNYSQKLPGFETPIKNLYAANIQQVYPWDRGTNYAIEMGQRIAKLIMEY